MTTPGPAYPTQPLKPATWDDFARLVETNNGVWGRCVGWCQYGGTGVARAAASGTHTGPETLFAELGFVRDRQIATWRWGIRLDLTG